MRKIIELFKNYKKNIGLYLLGFFVLGLAVNLIKASNLGSGAWDTVYINLYALLNKVMGYTWITMGMLSFAMSFTIMVIVCAYRRKWSYLFMIIPVIGVALSIDFWNILIIKDQLAEQLIYQIIFFILGIFVLPFGLSLIVKSGFTAYVFDELMLMFVKITKAKKITYVRLVIEFVGITIGLIFGYFAHYIYDGTFGSVNLGSLILTFTISPIMAVYFKVLKINHNK